MWANKSRKVVIMASLLWLSAPSSSASSVVACVECDNISAVPRTCEGGCHGLVKDPALRRPINLRGGRGDTDRAHGVSSLGRDVGAQDRVNSALCPPLPFRLRGGDAGSEGGAAHGRHSDNPGRRLLVHWSKLMLNYTPCSRSAHGLSAIAGKAYLFGGEAKARQTIDSVVHCLDVTKGWKTIEVGAGKVPPPRVGHAQCAMRNELLMVFGGRTCEEMGEGNLNDLWSYNPLNNDWTQVEGGGPVPEPRSFHCMTAIGDKLFVFGGCGAKGRLADLHQYDVKERLWSALPSPPALSGRGGASLNASPDGRSLWVCAGFVGHETNDIMRFDLATSTWHRADSDFLRPRSVCASFTLAYPSNPAVFLFGGEVSPSDKGHEGAGDFARDLIALDPATGAPLALSVESGAAPEARGWAAAAALSPTEAVLFGGLSGSDEAPVRLNDAWLLRIVT